MQGLIVGQTDQNRIQVTYLYYIILIMRILENRVERYKVVPLVLLSRPYGQFYI
jgi:hypothetical protein